MLTDHIALYDNVFSPDICHRLISLFDASDDQILSPLEEPPSHQKIVRRDVSRYIHPNVGLYSELMALLRNCFDAYRDNYRETLVYPLFCPHLKLQKTVPGGGYHTWHHEAGNDWGQLGYRELAFNVFLNDIESGGETEFLHQSIRIEPKAGSALIWPAHFTHAHRGNPPLRGEKYILTGWAYKQSIVVQGLSGGQ